MEREIERSNAKGIQKRAAIMHMFTYYDYLGGGFKYLFSSLPGEMIQSDGSHIFHMGWFNHQPAMTYFVPFIGISVFQTKNTCRGHVESHSPTEVLKPSHSSFPPDKFLGNHLPSLKLTAKAPENGWLEYELFPFGARPICRGVLVSFRECKYCMLLKKKSNAKPEEMSQTWSYSTSSFSQKKKTQMRSHQLSNKKQTGCLRMFKVNIGDYTIPLCEDYNKPL